MDIHISGTSDAEISALKYIFEGQVKSYMPYSISYVQGVNRMHGFPSDIVYRVRGMALSCGRLVYCVWVSRDPEEMGEGGRYCGGNLTLTSSFNSTVDNSLGQVKLVCHTI